MVTHTFKITGLNHFIEKTQIQKNSIKNTKKETFERFNSNEPKRFAKHYWESDGIERRGNKQWIEWWDFSRGKIYEILEELSYANINTIKCKNFNNSIE